VRFSHEFPWQATDATHVILMVRDPRDALYSEFKRQQHNAKLPVDVDFPDFTASPFMHGPISNRDLLWLHLHCWLLHCRATTLRVVRFEDCKLAPIDHLRDIAEWIGASATPAELVRAVQASDVRHLQRIEAELRRDDPDARQFNRRGVPFEWQPGWPRGWHQCYGAHWQPVLSRLQYPIVECASTALTSFDTDAVLRWRALEPSALFDRWRQQIDASRMPSAEAKRFSDPRESASKQSSRTSSLHDAR
jgi:hypothetical protein